MIAILVSYIATRLLAQQLRLYNAGLRKAEQAVRCGADLCQTSRRQLGDVLWRRGILKDGPDRNQVRHWLVRWSLHYAAKST